MFNMDNLKDFVSTGRGKAVTAGAAVVVIACVSFGIVSMTGASDGSLPASLSGSTSSSVSSDVTSSDDGTFVSSPAIDVSSGAAVSGGSSSASGDTSVAAESIKLNKQSVTLNVGESTQIAYAILPTNTTDISVSWDSSDKSVATINTSCTITAVSAGTTTIKVTASNGKSDTCAVTVKAASTGKSASTASKSGTSTKATSSTAVPKAAASAVNAASITDYASYGFKNGVSVTNTQVLTENWDFDQMVTDVTAGIELGDTVNYTSIPSDYRSKMCYYWGATTVGQSRVDDWINEIKKYHVIETCNFSTSVNDIYQDSNGNMLVRGKQTITVTSADSEYYSELGISGAGTYYRIIDVNVATGAQSSLGAMSIYSIEGEYKYTSWNKV
jgi:hypothetical protein